MVTPGDDDKELAKRHPKECLCPVCIDVANYTWAHLSVPDKGEREYTYKEKLAKILASKKNDLDDLTIFITVRDRQHNIRSQLEYYKDLNCKKIIADSSLKKANISEKEFLDAGFEYIYFGPMKIVEKMKRINDNSLTTDFIIWLGDDDSATKSALRECVCFLRDNPKYSVCDGKYYKARFYLKNNPKRTGEQYSLRYARRLYDNFYSECPKIRYLRALQNNYPRCHGVLRADAWREVIDLYYDNPFMPLQTIAGNIGFDVISNIIFAIRGNLKTFPSDPFYLRDIYVKRGGKIRPSAGTRLVLMPHIREELGLDKQNEEKISSTVRCRTPIANILMEEMKKNGQEINMEDALASIEDMHQNNLPLKHRSLPNKNRS